MSPEELSIDIPQLKKAVDELCRHLGRLLPDLPDQESRNQINNYRAIMEEASRDLTPAYEKALEERKTLLAQSESELAASAARMREATQRGDALPEEDILPLALLLRDEVLRRYALPISAVRTPEQKDVWEISSGEWRKGTSATKPETMKPGPPPTSQGKPAGPKGPEEVQPGEEGEAWDITSSEWKRDD